MKRIPLVPFPMKKALTISKKFRWLSQSLVRLAPGLKRDLYQSEMDINPMDYVGIAFFTSLFYSVVMGGVVTLSGLIFMGILDPIGMLVGLVFFFIGFYFLVFYPKITSKKRVKSLEKNL